MTTPPICDYEGSNYQISFWEQGGRVYEDRCEAIALRRLLPRHGQRLLELGAGAGRHTPRYTGFEQVILLDYSRTQLQQARARLGDSPRYLYVAADIYQLPFRQGLFDAATMIRVLHHMADAPAALRQVRRVLQGGGAFILEFANKRNLKAILRYLLRRQTWNPFRPEPIEFAPLNFDFHPDTVHRWLVECEFTIERILTVSHFRISLLKRRVPTSLLVSLDSLLQWTGALWQLTPSVFVRARAVGDTSSGLKVENPASYFQCPLCHHAPLIERGNGLDCPSCGKRWAIQDGIYDFRRPV